MNNYLFMLFTEQPRRYRVIENTIRNKRTQATLFWALNYQILNWLGSADHMTRNEFDAWMHHQQEQGLLMVQDDCAWLTKSGVHHKQRILKIIISHGLTGGHGWSTQKNIRKGFC